MMAAVIETLDAVLALAGRYANAARQAGRADIAAVLERVPANPATTFHEALQSLRLCHAVLWLSGHYHCGLGRFDQYLWPYLKADLESGCLDAVTAGELLAEFFNTTSKPVGHGFSLADANNGFACYSFVPKSAIPIKVIVLDDTQREDDGSADIHGHGFLDQARWGWLKKELADGDAAGQLMIIAAHIPIGVEPANSPMGWWPDPKNAVTLPDLVAELQSHPNLIMWISGHRHLNTVKAFISPDPVNAPEKGFWEVETSSLRDFPQQFRTFEIYLNSDYTISIVTTDVDPAVKDGTPAAISRSYAIAEDQIVEAKAHDPNPTNDPTIKPMPTGSYNAELVKQLSPAMTKRCKSDN